MSLKDVLEMKSIERSPLESKKFMAAMLWNLIWLFLIAFGIFKGVGDSVLLAMTYTSGGVQMLYLGGQSAVDAFVRRAHFYKHNPNDKASPQSSDS